MADNHNKILQWIRNSHKAGEKAHQHLVELEQQKEKTLADQGYTRVDLADRQAPATLTPEQKVQWDLTLQTHAERAKQAEAARQQDLSEQLSNLRANFAGPTPGQDMQEVTGPVEGEGPANTAQGEMGDEEFEWPSEPDMLQEVEDAVTHDLFGEEGAFGAASSSVHHAAFMARVKSSRRKVAHTGYAAQDVDHADDDV